MNKNRISFTDRYNSETTWHGKALVMEIYHLTMSHHVKGWKQIQTAEFFGVSVGLVSENLKLAHAIHKNERLTKCETRQEALKKING